MTGRTLGVLIAAAVLAACDQTRMRDQPKYEPYESAPGWPGGTSARRPVAGTIARGEPLDPAPSVPLTRALLERGREEYDVFCSPCHGVAGYGDGIVVQRGFPAPPSLHTERARVLPAAHVYGVITSGIGEMASYSARVPPEQRWAVAAYVRALQLSQHGRVEDLTPAQRARLGVEP